MCKLLAYCDTHFKTEERLFRQYRTPECSELFDHHVISHNKFRDYATQALSDFREEEGPVNESGVLARVVPFLQRWTLHHIQHEDKRYLDFIPNDGGHAPTMLSNDDLNSEDDDSDESQCGDVVEEPLLRQCQRQGLLLEMCAPCHEVRLSPIQAVINCWFDDRNLSLFFLFCTPNVDFVPIGMRCMTQLRKQAR